MGSRLDPVMTDAPLALAVQALEGRARALGEYLAVYRAGAGVRGRRRQRVRELSHDIHRLRAWAWYLKAAQHRPLWWRLLGRLGVALGGGQSDHPGQRHGRSRGIRRLSAFSVVDRAYAAQIEDYQGHLLTLKLAVAQRSGQDHESCEQRLEARVRVLTRCRDCLAENAGKVTVICTVLAQGWRLGGWLGLSRSGTRALDP